MKLLDYNAKTIPTMAWINDPKKNTKDMVAASLFAGCGGASTGLKLAGFDVRYASEFVPSAVVCYKANAAKSTFLDDRDIRKTKPAEVLAKCRVKRGELNLLDGSPPCKIYSQASIWTRGTGKAADAEVDYSDNVKQRVDDLFEHFVRMLRGIEPETFMAENVPGMLSTKNKGHFLEINSALEKSGYTVSAALIDASKLGVPQKRQRLVFLGVRKDLKANPQFPKPLPYVMSAKSVLPHIDAYQAQNGGNNDPDGWTTQWQDASFPTPTYTVMASRLSQYNNIGASGFVRLMSGVVRKMNIDELRTIFGFPKDFVLTGKFDQQWERLCRSHAPLAVYYLARQHRRLLEKL